MKEGATRWLVGAGEEQGNVFFPRAPRREHGSPDDILILAQCDLCRISDL